MSEFQLTRDYLDARDVESDCASLTQRIEAFRELEPTNDIPLIVREEDARSGQIESSIPEVAVEELTADAFAGVDLVIASTPDEVAAEFLPAAVAAGASLPASPTDTSGRRHELAIIQGG